MRSKLLRLTVACAAFVAGVLVVTVHRYVQQQRSVAHAEVPATSTNPVPELPVSEECPSYPETSGIEPHEIVNFINDHPKSNLDGLWLRLKVTDDASSTVQFSFKDACSLTEASIFKYNLDDDVQREVVVQIKHQYREMYRYLIFKDSRDFNPKFWGKIDIHTKYPPADPVVVVSNDRAWLIVQSTVGTGTGLAAWLDTVYEVSERGVREVGSYLGEVKQLGYVGYPSRTFTGRFVSCEIENGWATLKVSYSIEYFGYDTPLFTKRKTAVLVQSLKGGSTFVDANRSEISPSEFQTVYNFDSMGLEDFLTYNRHDLRAIAASKKEGVVGRVSQQLRGQSDQARTPKIYPQRICVICG